MRLDNYIVLGEEVDGLQMKVEGIIETIFKDCEYYISQLRKSNAFKLLYRGTRDGTNFYKLKTSNLERGRKPKDMGKIMHDLLNDEIFRPEFGWNVRDGIFASSKLLTYYGDPYLFFPVGEFKYVWSPTVQDLYEDMFDKNKLDFLYYYVPGKLINSSYVNDLTEEVVKISIKNLQLMYQDNNFKMAVRSENEIAFKCDKYYIVNRYMVDDFEKYMLDLIYHPNEVSKYDPFK